MLSTALKIQTASHEAVVNDIIMSQAAQITQLHDIVDEETFHKMLFQYSASLSALTASLVTEAILTEEQFNEMINSIDEMDSISKEVLNGNMD